MTDRRTFVRGATAGALLAALGDARVAFAAELDRLTVRRAPRNAFHGLAAEYLLGPDVLYFNHGSIGTIPRIVHEAHVRYLTVCESNPWLHMWGEAWDAPREEVRARAAALLRCAPDEVAITHNTTEGFNLLAHGLDLRAGDEVVFSSLNHPGASVCWNHYAAARGFTVRRFEFPVQDAPSMTPDDVVALHLSHLTDRTRVLVVPHIDNTLGMLHPVRELARAARARGVEYIAVDGAQALGMVPVDVRAADIDFYSSSPHKWLQAPKGLGLFYARASVQPRVRAMWITSGQGQLEGSARAFENYGTRNLPEALALGDAIAFQQSLGESAKLTRYNVMRDRFRAAVDASGGRLRWLSPAHRDLASSIYLIEVAGQPSAQLFERLYRDHGVVFRAFRTQGIDGMRVSPNVQTTDQEIDRFIGLVTA